MNDYDDFPEELTEAQKRMIDDRFAAHDRAPETSIPWEEVRARLFALDRNE
jgi:putative addiction module component (TIGR02574 family)